MDFLSIILYNRLNKEGDFMLYTFMNKNYKLFDFEYDLKINAITKIITLYDKERLPVNLYSLNEDELLNSFNTWLNQRYSRNSEWFKKQQWNYDFMKLTSNLVVKSYGLSLSDQYWIKPSNIYCNRNIRITRSNFINCIKTCVITKKQERLIL